MITAATALALQQARLTQEERAQLRAILAACDAHVRKHMTFVGVLKKLELNAREMTQNVAKALCLMLAKPPYSWQVIANLFSLPPDFTGGTPISHHWEIVLAPLNDAYDTVDGLTDGTAAEIAATVGSII